MRKMFLLALMLLALFAVNAHAGSSAIGIDGGVLKGTGDFGDATKTGYGGGAFYDYWVSNMLAVGADFGWNTAKSKTSDDIKVTLINYGAHLKYAFPMSESKVHPYVTAGAGMYNVKVKAGSAESSDNKFGGHGGLGLEYMVNPQVGVGAEANFHFISTEGTSTQAVTGVAMVTYHLPSATK